MELWHGKQKTFEDVHRSAVQRVKTLCDNMDIFYQKIRKYELLFQKRTVSNSFLEALEQSGYKNEAGVIHRFTDVFDYNIIRQNCVAARNQITSSKPKVVFQTEDQPYETIQTAEKLSSYISSVFKDQDVYSKAAAAFLNACIMNLGILKLNSYKNIVNLNPKYFFCDSPYRGNSAPIEGGNYSLVSPYALLSMFPDKKKQITEEYINNGDKNDISDVVVYDLYYAGKKSAKFCKKILYSYKVWKYDFIPYEFFRWEASTEGVIQMSISDELYKAHEHLETTIKIIEESIQSVGIPVHWVPKSAKLSESALTERVPGIVLEYSGIEKPMTSAPKPIDTQYFAWIDNLFARSAQACGNNPMNMTGELPKGLNQPTGIALQNYSDLDSKKFSDIRDYYESRFPSLARKVLLMGGPKALNFDPALKDIKIAEELSKMQLEQKSFLPDSPAGQMQAITLLVNSGKVDPEQAWAMLKHPDLQKMLSSLSDRTRQIDLLLERAMKENKMPVLYKELGVDVYLDRARRLFATIQRQKGENYLPLTKLSIFIDDLLYEMKIDQEMVIRQMQGPQPNINTSAQPQPNPNFIQ